ncbi:hypothetical protein M3Y94_00243800 [Aphelenchoides besseyi]|nr:hypothetical protein M3Y94_00243800 [Aphelenchoides besseyi]
MSLVLGIDFGTSTTKAAVVRDNKIEIIRDVNGNSVLPSCVSFTKRKLFGDDALTQMSVDPCNSVYEAKRLIGCYFDDPFVASDRRFWACRVGRSFDQGQPRFNVDYRSKRRFFAIEIAAILMREMKQNAERMFSTKIDEVVMAVPACFNTLQRKAMEDVVHIAGLSIKRTLNEPTAIALAYYNRKRMPSKAELVLVLDIGGGFFDVSVLTVGSQNLRVRGTAGGRWGGIDIDNTLTSHFASEIKTIHRIDLFDKTHAKTLFLLRRKCEQAKNQTKWTGS